MSLTLPLDSDLEILRLSATRQVPVSHVYPDFSTSPHRSASSVDRSDTSSERGTDRLGNAAVTSRRARQFHKRRERNVVVSYQKIVRRHSTTFANENYGCYSSAPPEGWTTYLRRMSVPSIHRLGQNDKALCDGRKYERRIEHPQKTCPS